jgi:streptogramin lyase
MKSPKLNTLNRNARAVFLMAAWAAACACLHPMRSRAAEATLLGGRVTSSSGKALAGIPVRAHRDNGNITVSVYSNSRGEYSFPEWSAVSPGSYSVAIEVPEYVPVRREAVSISAGKNARLDFTLQSRQPSILDATASEIALAMPGTEDQRFMLTQCDQCHSLQFALRTARSKQGWLQVVRLMAGTGTRASDDAPGTKAFDQKRFIEPMADYLASIRGPGSSDEIPFQMRPRPTGEASTRLVVTEYDIPRGGSRDVYLMRGDRRFVWPHDVVVDPNGRYVWYADHFQFILGRLDQKTGDVKEFPYTVLPGMDSTELRIGRNFGGGAHKIRFDPEGNIVLGVPHGTVIFNPRTEQFKPFASGMSLFAIDRDSNVWYLDRELHKLDTKTGEVKSWPAPREAGGYDMEIDSQGRFVSIGWRSGKIGMFDPKTEKFTLYPTPTPESGPRRGNLDSKDRYWVSLYWAGRVGVFDPNKGAVHEFSLIPDVKPFGPPFVAAYTVAVDDKRQLAWAEDFNSNRVYLIDMKTERSTEFLMPLPYEVRDLVVDKSADRPTLWIPAYRAPAKMVKVQVR